MSKQKPENSPASGYRYETLARQITQLIQQGTFRPGERIPSVRQMSKQQAVSISTVMQAYLILENEGLSKRVPNLVTSCVQ